MSNQAVVFRTDGTKEELDHRPSLKEAQEIVGGYLELVKVGNGVTLVVDEEGLVKHKPLNKTITNLYGQHICGGLIVGNVIALTGWRTVGN